jgi:hypothetical protein
MFIDFPTAYAKINRTRLWLAIHMMVLPNKLTRLAGLTTEQEISVLMYNQMSTSFYSNTGLKQGDSLAQLLCNIALFISSQQSQCNLIGTILSNKTANVGIT